MLLEFSCSNHKSIKDKVVFSAIASKDNTFEDRLATCRKYRISKISAIYGANGSGKSNFIDAIRFMKLMVVNSINHQPGDEVLQQPHKLLGYDAPSEYNMRFVVDDVIYAYGFTLQNKKVVDEYLYYFPNNRQKQIFERTEDDYIPGDAFKSKFDSCKDVFKKNRLFLSCAANFSSVEEIENVFNFFKTNIVVYNRGVGIDDWKRYSLETISENKQIKDTVLTFLKNLGTDIRDINIKKTEASIPIEELPPVLSEEFKTAIATNNFTRYDTFIHYEKFDIKLEEESSGIQKLIEFLCPLIDIIVTGKILLCDEMETNFHESIFRKIIEIINNLKSHNHAQVFFTTHDTNILDLNIFRRDQIWFTELEKDTRSTDMYSLIEMNNVRKDENLAKGYISGKYGAIPMLNSNMKLFIENLQHNEE